MGQSLVESKLPNLKETNYSGWKVISYDEYIDVLELDQKKCTELDSLIGYCENNETTDFRFALNVVDLQFFLGVFTDNKEIIIFSKQLSRELTIAGLYEDDTIWSNSDLNFRLKACLDLDLSSSPKVIDYITYTNNLPAYIPNDKLELETHRLTDALLHHVRKYKQGSFEKFSDFGLNMTAHYELIRIHLLKFLAILPCLDHDKEGHEVRRILSEALERFIKDNQTAKEKEFKGQKRSVANFYIVICKMLLSLVKFLPASLMAKFVRRAVEALAKRFIAGVDMMSARSALKDLASTKREATIDQLGELIVTKKEADQYCENVIDVINGFKSIYKAGEVNTAGILKAHVSVKITALAHDFKPYDLSYSYEQIAPRLTNILLTAKKEQVFLNIDAEHYHYRDCVLEIYGRILRETAELADYKDTGIVLQAYLRDGYKHFKDILSLATERKLVMPIRLVKGAYWDAETIEARAHNYEAPQFLNKEETDIYYRQLMEVILQNGEFVQLTVAGHNISDHCYAEALRCEKYSDAPTIEHQCLHMTYEALSTALAKMGWATRNYIPVGNLLVGMAYLVRRIIENSSQVGVLTIMRSHKNTSMIMPAYKLLEQKEDYEYDDSLSNLNGAFRNVQPLRTHIRAELESLQFCIDKTNFEFIGEKFKSSKIVSSDSSLKMKDISFTPLEDVDTKIQALFNGYKTSSWKEQGSYRFNSLCKLSDMLLFNRSRLSSLIMLEAGKTQIEATADVDEAIDFISFYLRQQIKTQQTIKSTLPKGVVAVVAPWNFPLAIPVGMSIAALSCGNTVLLKPAEQTSVIIDEFMKLVRKCGIDSNIFDVAYGDAEIGKLITQHELLNGVVFTGSKSVGTNLFKNFHGALSSNKYEEEKCVKTIITEMGGKNAIIVTNNCELDETVSGVLYSAFAHAGQKCSACSRVIVDKNVKKAFLKRFVQATSEISVGSAMNFDTTINPLITPEDKVRVQKLAKEAAEEAKSNGGVVHLDRSTEEFSNNCVGPAIIEVPKNVALNRSSVASKEVFGPVIHIVEYSSLDEALEIFNSTEYALTGGVYAQSQDDIDYLLPKLECGNIYVNRPNTGARVAIEPFGGFKMSGTGPKAGSFQYLDAFQTSHTNVFDHEDDDNQNKIYHQSYPQFSALGIRHKKDILQTMMSHILGHWGDLFISHAEENKSRFKELMHYLIDIKTLFNYKKYPNRLIPGQQSYDLKNIKLKRSCFLIHSAHITPIMLFHLMVNIFLGNGITILVNNKVGFESYQRLCSLLFKWGVSPINLCLEYTNSFLTIDYLKKMHFDSYVFDTSGEAYSDFCSILNEFRIIKQLPKTFWSGNLYYESHPEKYIENYVHRRSVAVNTMRHGAPMVINLEGES